MTTDKPVVGVMSPLPVMGLRSPAVMQRDPRAAQPWAFIGELQRDFNVKAVDLELAGNSARDQVARGHSSERNFGRRRSTRSINSSCAAANWSRLSIRSPFSTAAFRRPA